MDIRFASHPDHAETLSTESLRDEFLVQEIFQKDVMTATYSHHDRIIFGGILPISGAVTVPESMTTTLACAFLLERREMGIINIGGDAKILLDGVEYTLANEEALYIGRGVETLSFESLDITRPAKLYYNCAPAHTTFPTRKVTLAEAMPERLGAQSTSNLRTIYKYIVPGVADSCQLLMGMTKLDDGNLWNTFPPHTHDRRMEVYFYFNMQDSAVFHMMGRPNETRHIVVRNEEAVISPSWSIHSGVGTAAYTFIWGMVGENQTFSDMDKISLGEIY